MSVVDIFPAEAPEREPWFCEVKDRDPASEIERQEVFLADLAKLAPRVHAIAIPNAGRRTRWEAGQRAREGLHRGALDLILLWTPDLTVQTGRCPGVWFAEFKNGSKDATPAQVDELNRLTRMGFGCGVYRTSPTLLSALRRAGAPFLRIREGRL